MYEEIEEIIKSENKNKNPKIAAFSWTEAGQFSSLMKNKYQTLVLDTDPHHFSYLEKNKKENKMKKIPMKVSDKTFFLMITAGAMLLIIRELNLY